MTTWAKVEKGDVVELGGKPYTVKKIKAKGKKATLTVTSGAGTFSSEVKLADKVKLVPATSGKRAKLHDADGGQQRWAKKKEVEKVLGLPEGDHSQHVPPPVGSLVDWSPSTKAEKKLDALLEARLVGHADDENVGYYVPPVDAETVAAHWAIFHEGEDWVEVGESELLEHHARQHAAVFDGLPLKVNHWHTPERPEPAP